MITGMRSVPSPIRVALLLALAVLALAVLPLPADASPDGPVRVTSDSTAYCAELASRLAEQPHGHAEPARSLAEEGQRLCGKGHVRTGIAKLRRALRAAQAGG